MEIEFAREMWNTWGVNKVVMGVILVLVVVMGIVLWRQQSKSQIPMTKSQEEVVVASPTGVSETVEPTGNGTVKEFTVTAANFKYDVAEMKVKKGDTVKITFKNSEGFHDLVLDEFDVATNQIGAGDEEEVEFVADKTGKFEYYCSVGNHRKIGMQGSLIVE